MKPLRYWLNLSGVTVLSVSLALIFTANYLSSQWARVFLHPARIPPNSQWLEARGIPYQDIKLTTSDGIVLSAWYTPPQNGAVILAAHGYNANRPESIHALFAEHDYGVLTWDFRAHGVSGGDISTLGDNEQLDVKAALDFVLAQDDVGRAGAWGGSMGATTVLLAAAHHPELEAVIADSSFPTFEDVLGLNVPIAFLQPAVGFWWEFHSGAKIDDIRPVDVIGNISPRAVLIIDGWEGAAIAMNSPYRLYEAANEPKQIWVEDGVPHLGMFAHNPEEYADTVIGFLDTFLLNK